MDGVLAVSNPSRTRSQGPEHPNCWSSLWIFPGEHGIDTSVTPIALVSTLRAMVEVPKILPKNLHELRDAITERQSVCKCVIPKKQRKPSIEKRKVT